MCPKVKSCGTWFPLWTDASDPEKVGVVTGAYAYEAYYDGQCAKTSWPIEIMRCSKSTNDLIYRQVTYDFPSCSIAFCSMV